MRKKDYSCRSLIWSSLQVAVGAALLFLVACWRIGGDLPTRAPDAEVPTLAVGARWEGTLPPTYTPLASRQAVAGGASYVATPAATSTLPAQEAVPVAAPPPTASPTPFNPPDYLLRTVSVRNLDQPPLATDCGEHGTVIKSRYPSDIFGPWRDYHVYLPPCYGQDGRVYPVLYLFHGSGWTDTQWVELGIAQHIDQGIAEGRYPPFIVVMPNNEDVDDKTSGGRNSVEGIILEALMPFVEEKFCTWNTRDGRSLGGISRGGYWALMLAFRHTELFGAVSGHSSQLRLDVDPAEYNPRATYASADLSQTRIWMDWGHYDFLRPGQLYLHQSLMDAGIAHRAQVFSGGHSQPYWYAHAGEYLSWHASNWPSEREAYPFCQLAATQ